MLFAKACVFVSFLLIWLPRFFVLRSAVRMPGGLDNHLPREQQGRLDDLGKRAQGAHMNAFESFAPFAVAVLFATTSEARVDPSVVNGLAGAHVGLRLLYTWAYLTDRPSLRSTIWMCALGVVGAIFVVTLVA